MITLTNLLSRLPGGTAQGLIYGIMAIGIYISYKVLYISDLTADGSFATGGAISVMLIVSGMHPAISLFLAFLAGMLIGTVTGLLHTKGKIEAILAGILVQFGLYSVNLRLLKGSANVSCNPDRFALLISMRDIPQALLIVFLIAALLVVSLYWYFGTEQGCAVRATGCNQRMAIAQSINTDQAKIIGLALSNGIIALAGGLMSQFQGFADVNMGRGSVVIGLAAIIIGEMIEKILFRNHRSFYIRLTAVFFGGIVYYIIMTVILWLRVNSNDLKLFTALIVALLLILGNKNQGEKNA
ncbi:MAG: ABC transporter permease [Erysipelotrichia bacterium]|nr:ABC transporter permease [Erysipelotrichia bacterium]